MMKKWYGTMVCKRASASDWIEMPEMSCWSDRPSRSWRAIVVVREVVGEEAEERSPDSVR